MHIRTNKHTYHYQLHCDALGHLDVALHHVTIQCSTAKDSTARRNTYQTARYVTYSYVTLPQGRAHSTTFRCSATHDMSLHVMSLDTCKNTFIPTYSNLMTVFDIASKYIAARCAAFHCIAVLHYIVPVVPHKAAAEVQNKKPIGKQSRMAEWIHWWTERWLELCFLEWLHWSQWSPHPQLLDVVWRSAAVVVAVV